MALDLLCSWLWLYLDVMNLPSVKEYIKGRICNLSQICFLGAAAIKRHSKGDCCTKRQGGGDEDTYGEDEEDEEIAI